MSNVAEPFQRDELHLFLAVLLHVVAGLLIYALLSMGEDRPRQVMLEGLPIVFGKMISPGEPEGNEPKTLAKSTPPEARATAPETAARPADAPVQQRQQPESPRTAAAPAAKTPAQPEARPPETIVSETRSRPPAAVALDSPPGPQTVPENVPTLRLKPEPEEADRPPPPEATTSRTAEASTPEPQKQAPPAAARALDEAAAKLANPPAVKPAIVPQHDTRPGVVAPPKSDERKPEPAEAETVKLAETKPADEAKAARAATGEPKPAPVPEIQKTSPVDVATATPKDQAAPAPPPPTAPETVVAPKDIPAAKTAAAEPTKAKPAAITEPKPPETTTSQQAPVVQAETQSAEAVSEPEGQATGATPVPPQKAEEPAQAASAGTGAQEPASGGGTEAQTDKGPSGQRSGLDALREFSALSGLGAGKKGVPGGTSATGSELAAMQAEGSRLAQACLEQKQVFKMGDNISATFRVEISRAQRRLHLLPDYKLHRGDRLTGPRITEIDTALNTCDAFKSFVLQQEGLRTFSFKFESGRR